MPGQQPVAGVAEVDLDAAPVVRRLDERPGRAPASAPPRPGTTSQSLACDVHGRDRSTPAELAPSPGRRGRAAQIAGLAREGEHVVAALDLALVRPARSRNANGLSGARGHEVGRVVHPARAARRRAPGRAASAPPSGPDGGALRGAQVQPQLARPRRRPGRRRAASPSWPRYHAATRDARPAVAVPLQEHVEEVEAGSQVDREHALPARRRRCRGRSPARSGTSRRW